MFRIKKLTPPSSLGFAHYIVPILMVAVIAVVGGYVLLNGSSAATLTGAVYLESGVSGKCLDDAYDKATNGTKIQSYACNKSAAQAWELNTNGTIENANGKCIDNDYGKNLNDNPITVYTCSASNTAEQWKNTGSILKNPTTNKCIDLPYGTTKNGTALQLYTCNGKKQQSWSGVKVSASTGSTGSTSGGGNGGGSSGIGTSAPPTSGTNSTVDFRTTAKGTQPLNTYSIGDTISTYPGSNGATISTNTDYRNELAALGPLAWRVPERDTNGTATGAGAGGGGTGYVEAIKEMNGVPVVIASGQGNDDDFNDGQITSLVKYYNDNGGQNGGPVTSWIVGNEPEGNGGFSAYANNLPGVISAINSADPSIPVKISAGTVWDQGDISLLSQIAGDKGISYLSWHAYQGGDGNGANSGNYAGPIYESEEQQAQATASAHGEESGIEEFNWDSGCSQGGPVTTWQNELFIASVIGNILAGGGAHAYMYSDTNGGSGCDTINTSTGQQPAYWALGMWTGMNGEFDRFGTALVDTTVNGVDVTNASGKEGSGIQHDVELFATNNGKILAINENSTTSEAMTIGIGGYTSGTYNVWQTSQNNAVGTAGAPKEVTTNASFSGSKISITLPGGTISSIDVK
jgi:hypothetical protein